MIEKFGEWVESIKPNLFNIRFSDDNTTTQYIEVARDLGLPLLNGSFKMTPLQFNSQFVVIAWEDNESPLIHGMELLYDIAIISGEFAKLPSVELRSRLRDSMDNIHNQMSVKDNDAINTFESMFSVLVEDYADSVKEHA